MTTGEKTEKRKRELLEKYQNWMIERMVEGDMQDFSQPERDRIFREWCGYGLFMQLLDAMIEDGFTIKSITAQP